MDRIKHPAQYSEPIIHVLADMMRDQGFATVLDPFAGAGGIFRLRDEHNIPGLFLGYEIEPEFVALHPHTRHGNALRLPLADGIISHVITSPAYGNRMADQFIPGEGWEAAKTTRNTYAHRIGRKLHPNNGGGMQWGEEYRDFHLAVWKEMGRVLAPDGQIILNISDHIRSGELQPVKDWHASAITSLGYRLSESVPVQTRRNRYGQNGHVRVDCEWVMRFERDAMMS